jgi:hypothetical protein
MVVIQLLSFYWSTLSIICSELKRIYEIIRSLLWLVNLASESFFDIVSMCNIKN